MATKTAKIKTYDQACKKLGLDPAALPDLSAVPEKHRKAILAHLKLVTVAEALNDGWTPNWNDSNEMKYYPWFEVKADDKRPGGFDFLSVYYGWGSVTDVGSRLCFRSRELALYAGKQFKDLYIDYMLIG